MKKRILITGVAGFIGSNLALQLLGKGYDVMGIDNLAYGMKGQIPKGVKFHKADIRSKKIPRLFKNVDVVFHLAAKNCISDCQGDPLDTVDVNICGTVNVLDACCRASVKKVIYAETSAIYEDTSVFPTPETEQAPISFYAGSKLAAGYFARSFSRTYGLKVTGLRYFNVYGPRQDYRRSIPPVFCAFIIALLKNRQPVIYGSGEKRRDFIHVDDVNAFHLLALRDSRTDNQVFNLGSGRNYSINEIYRLICQLLRTDRRARYAKDLPAEAQVTLADISKARRLGWRPSIDLKQGLLRSIEYIQEHVIHKIK